MLWDRTDLIVVGCSGIWGSLGWYLRVGLRHDEGAGENMTANRWGTEWSGTGRGLARVARYRQCRRGGGGCAALSPTSGALCLSTAVRSSAGLDGALFVTNWHGLWA